MSCIDKFMPLLMEKEEEGTQLPIIQYGDVTFIYIKCNNLYSILSNSANCFNIYVTLFGLTINLYIGFT